MKIWMLEDDYERLPYRHIAIGAQQPGNTA